MGVSAPTSGGKKHLLSLCQALGVSHLPLPALLFHSSSAATGTDLGNAHCPLCFTWHVVSCPYPSVFSTVEMPSSVRNILTLFSLIRAGSCTSQCSLPPRHFPSSSLSCCRLFQWSDCLQPLGARLTVRQGFQGVVLPSCFCKGPKAHSQPSGQMPS